MMWTYVSTILVKIIIAAHNSATVVFRRMSSNQHLERKCPAMMSDGRFLSNWESSQVINDKIAITNGFIPGKMDNNRYRQFLQHNGNRLREIEWKHFRENYSCPRVSKAIPIEYPYATK